MTTRELFWPSLVVGMFSTASLITTRFVVTKVVPSTFVRTLWYIALSLLRMRLVHRTFGAVVVPKVCQDPRGFLPLASLPGDNNFRHLGFRAFRIPLGIPS